MTDISIPTQAGIQWNAQSAAGQEVLPITEIAFGTSDRVPSGNETGLADEVYRQTISDFGTRENDTQAFFQVPLVGADQTFTFQEIGLFLSDGTMVGVARRAAPQLVGPLDSYTYEFIVAYSALEAIVVEVDPIHGITENRTINTQTGLSGGGNLTQDRTLVTDWSNLAAPIALLRSHIMNLRQGSNQSQPNLGDLSDWLITELSRATRNDDRLVIFGDLADSVRTDEEIQDMFAQFLESQNINITYDDAGNALSIDVLPATTSNAGIVSLGEIDNRFLALIRNNPTYPEIQTVDNRLALTDDGAGIIKVDDTQTWLWRGLTQISSDDFDLADRSFATVANKTYHLRWNAPGTGNATPQDDWPNGRFELVDLTNATPAETDPIYDSTYDRMLIARIITDSQNAANIQALANAAVLKTTGQALLTSSNYTYEDEHNPSSIENFLNIYVLWARQPIPSMTAFNDFSRYLPAWGSSTDAQTNIGVGPNDRYGFRAWQQLSHGLDNVRIGYTATA